MLPPDALAPVDPLDPLRERARSSEAGQEDIDALLAECDRVLGPEEDKRERFRVLHLIIEDSFLGGFRGGDQRRVDETAARAVLALGEPYAQELSATGRDVLHPPPPEPKPKPPRPRPPPRDAAPAAPAATSADAIPEARPALRRLSQYGLVLLGVEALLVLGNCLFTAGIVGLLFGAVLCTCLSLFPALALRIDPEESRSYFATVLVLNLLGAGAVAALSIGLPTFVYFAYFGPFLPAALLSEHRANMEQVLPWLLLSVAVRLVVACGVLIARWPPPEELQETHPGSRE
ncbi:hypothetical protein [Archangium primigenium]|uniref:hypothetical protein n=1 Tax=[Archangium] primigenium TaxID=2792470 RepID=UPI001956E8A9|nr:hypothetical protein [Archangium primigenium]MBM7112737.1 hypothetical protein [Archangium primigenium]